MSSATTRFGPNGPSGSGPVPRRQRVSKAFLGLVVFCLTLLFASFGLFARHNVLSALASTLCALAVSGAVEMVLELEQPFGGLLHISPLPMRQAVDALAS
jgi:hypothetical protein